MRFWSGVPAGMVQKGLSRTDLEAVIRQLLAIIDENGYGLFRVMDSNAQEWSYMVRKPGDMDGKKTEMTDPRLILHDPRACGALLFSANQFLV